MSWKNRIRLKSPAELEKMAASARVLADVFRALPPLVGPGVTTGEIDAAVERMIRDAGCIPSFKGYNGFPAASCISVNDVVVHGIPTGLVLAEGYERRSCEPEGELARLPKRRLRRSRE